MAISTDSSDKRSIEVSEKRQFSDDAYKNPSVLKELYHDKGLTSYEIGDALGVSKSTILRYMQKHEIDRRNRGVPRVQYASYGTTEWGYPRWQTMFGGEWSGVYVHQLTAVAAGADPNEVFSDETAVHHRNTVKFDNRAKNLEVIDVSDHQGIHTNPEWEFDERLSCRVIKSEK